jgi:hypothetical protein
MGIELGALRRFVDRAVASSGERCEMCVAPIGEEHPHLVNVETRRLLCACRPCYLLFMQQGAARGKLRAVPERYRVASSFRLDEKAWSALQIPVRMAFFFQHSAARRYVAFYPSPAGATESLLGLAAWQDILDANPVLADLEPDVETLLVRGRKSEGFDCFLTPIDACYELVGRVRKTWRGFDGGEEAWREIDGFFESIKTKSEEIG